MSTVTLKTVNAEDVPEFKRRLQDAFTRAALEAFPDFPEVIPPDRDIDESLALENQYFSKCFATSDQKEGMAAFLGKRPAVFKNE